MNAAGNDLAGAPPLARWLPSLRPLLPFDVRPPAAPLDQGLDSSTLPPHHSTPPPADAGHHCTHSLTLPPSLFHIVLSSSNCLSSLPPYIHPLPPFSYQSCPLPRFTSVRPPTPHPHPPPSHPHPQRQHVARPRPKTCNAQRASDAAHRSVVGPTDRAAILFLPSTTLGGNYFAFASTTNRLLSPQCISSSIVCFPVQVLTLGS